MCGLGNQWSLCIFAFISLCLSWVSTKPCAYSSHPHRATDQPLGAGGVNVLHPQCPFDKEVWPPGNRAIFISSFCPWTSLQPPPSVFLTVPFRELLYWGPLPRTLARLITVWAVGVASLQLFLSWGTSWSPFLWVQCAPASLQQPVMSGKSGSRDRFRARNWECYSVGAQKTLARKERVTPILPLACCVTQANFLSWVGKGECWMRSVVCKLLTTVDLLYCFYLHERCFERFDLPFP